MIKRALFSFIAACLTTVTWTKAPAAEQNGHDFAIQHPLLF